MSNVPIAGLCGGRTAQGYCERRPLQGSKRCKRHNGRPLVGAANPAFKTGRHSKYLPPRLQDRYQEALRDATLLSVRDEIALLDARLEDLLRRADTGEAGKIWERLKQQR